MARILVALGGNALARSAGAGTWSEAHRQMRRVAPALAGLVGEGHELLLTHGNGPQVGRLLRQEEIAGREVPLLPIDVLDAESEGQIGYLIQQELTPVLQRRGLHRPVLPMIGRIEVARTDPAFRRPTKPVGGFYSPAQARLLRARHRWAMQLDRARGGWRRLLPSPRPRRWLEADAVRAFLELGGARSCIPVVTGGGGVPVVRTGRGRYAGVEAVIDKDRTAALVARTLAVESLVIVTDVPAACLGFGTARERPLGRVAPALVARALRTGEFGEGSMAPKIEASLDFVRRGGGRAIITDIGSLGEALRGRAGTRIEEPQPAGRGTPPRGGRRSGRGRRPVAAPA
jgi:carbamate kinase